jgi:hypothetical protein
MQIPRKIIEKYEAYSKLMFGSPRDFPLSTAVADFGGRHVEVHDDGKICLIGTDRGTETLRLETYSQDEFLYWLFRSYANSKAFHNYDEPYDFQKIQGVAVSEMRKISDEWADRLRSEQQAQMD